MEILIEILKFMGIVLGVLVIGTVFAFICAFWMLKVVIPFTEWVTGEPW